MPTSRIFRTRRTIAARVMFLGLHVAVEHSDRVRFGKTDEPLARDVDRLGDGKRAAARASSARRVRPFQGVEDEQRRRRQQLFSGAPLLDDDSASSSASKTSPRAPVLGQRVVDLGRPARTRVASLRRSRRGQPRHVRCCISAAWGNPTLRSS
jgi:hypothetical protein